MRKKKFTTHCEKYIFNFVSQYHLISCLRSVEELSDKLNRYQTVPYQPSNPVIFRFCYKPRGLSVTI